MNNNKIVINLGKQELHNLCLVHKEENNHPKIICKAWKLSEYFYNIDKIVVNNLEVLSNLEADRALRNWLKVLTTNGLIQFTVPNMDYYCHLWLNAKWTEDALLDSESDAKISFAGIWGHQASGDPWNESYSEINLDCNRSGYNSHRIHLLMSRIGYNNIETNIINKKQLSISATKTVNNSERQTAKNLIDVRIDHRKRYDFAKIMINKSNSTVIDAACGVGYGAYILSTNENINKIIAIDISEDAITQARSHYATNKINYQLMNLDIDLFDNSLLDEYKPDYFVSFETIEHLNHPNKFIEKVSNLLASGGVFIGSTPNEEIMPYSAYKFQYHTKHFTNEELLNLLEENKFYNIELYGQSSIAPSELVKDKSDSFIIFKAIKK